MRKKHCCDVRPAIRIVLLSGVLKLPNDTTDSLRLTISIVYLQKRFLTSCVRKLCARRDPMGITVSGQNEKKRYSYKWYTVNTLLFCIFVKFSTYRY